MNFQQYQLLRQKAKEDYEKTLDSIDKTWNLYQEHFSSPSSSSLNGNKTDMIKNAINNVGEPFDVKNIVGYLENAGQMDSVGKGSIYNTLMRLAKDNKYIRVVEQGSGKKGSKYVRVKQGENKPTVNEEATNHIDISDFLS